MCLHWGGWRRGQGLGDLSTEAASNVGGVTVPMKKVTKTLAILSGKRKKSTYIYTTLNILLWCSLMLWNLSGQLLLG